MDQTQLFLAKNVSDNGRWFCGLVAIIDAVTGNPKLGLLMALCVGAAVIVDQVPLSWTRVVASLAVYAAAIGVFVASFLVLG